MEWRIKIGEGEFSANSTEVLKEWYSQGRIPLDSYIYHPVLARWMYAKDLEELRTVPPVRGPMATSQPANVGAFSELSYMVDMTDSQRLVFQNEMAALRKDPTTAVLLTLFLGGLGVHHFYFGSVGLGVLYLVFCWTFIPALVALVETFFAADRARQFNAQKAAEVAARVKSLSR